MPRVTFLQVDRGGEVAHTIVDLLPDGTAWDTIDPMDTATIPKVTLYGEGGSTVLVAEKECTVLAPTALEAAVDAKAKSIAVTSAAGIERWSEIVIGPGDDGRWEWAIVDGVTIGGIGSDDTIYLLAPLKHAYSDGSAVGKRTLSTSYTGAQIGQVLRGCRLEWKYLRRGRTVVESTIVHCSRYAPRYALSGAEVQDAEPKAARMLGPDQQIDLIIRREWERRVLPSIARIMPPGALVAGEAADELLLAAVCQRLCTAARDFEIADRWGSRYEDLFGGLRDTLTDIDESGDIATTEQPRSASAARLLRG